VMTDVKSRGQMATALDNGEFSVPHWCILVYARPLKLADMDAEISMNLTGQRRLWCNLHRLFLVKQPVQCDLTYCVKHCSRKARWACYGRGITCLHAVCLSHGKVGIAGSDIISVKVDMLDCRRPTAAQSVLNTSDALPGLIFIYNYILFITQTIVPCSGFVFFNS